MKVLFAIITIVALAFSLVGCSAKNSVTPTEEPDNTSEPTAAPTEEPTRVPKENVAKVILILGQSNAVGATLYSPLKSLLDDEEYQEVKAGYSNVKLVYYCEAGGEDGVNTGKNINYKRVDKYTSVDALFKKTKLGMSWDSSMFGPEVGLAQYLTSAAPDETFFVIKVAKGAVSINSSWREGKYCYDNMVKVVDICFNVLKNDGYTPEVTGILWMQGEDEACSETDSLNYLQYQTELVADLRARYAEYAPYGGIPFIDAGISSYWAYYENVNNAKREFAKLSDLNYYFDTMEMGLTYNKEPAGNVDLCHFDSLSVLALGNEFGRIYWEAYQRVK